MVRIFGVLWAASVVFAQPVPAPDAQEQHAILSRITENALRAQQQLPDFICTQRTKRSEDETGKGRRWKQRDTLEIEFTFANQRPSWKLIRRDRRTHAH